MNYPKIVLLLIILINANQFCQQLPLRIGNQWHYNSGLAPVSPYIATVIDTVIIDGKLFFKIERTDIASNEVIRITYDRIDGDSSYYRIVGNETLVFNFNWVNGHLEEELSPYDTSCFELKYIQRDTTDIWGVFTDKYFVIFGITCDGYPDTGWTLSGSTYLKYFGCWSAMDGELIGAIINDVTYGTLHQITNVADIMHLNDFSLSQNYPNPFNPSTTISFTLPQDQFVELNIYDILGNKVYELVNENKPVGKNIIEFDTGNLSSGIYFYRIKTDGFIEAKKLILLK